MQRARWFPRLWLWSVCLSLAAAALTFTAGCRRKPTPEQRLESNPAPSPIATAEPIPLEPPVETLRVPNSGFPCAVDDVLAAKCRRCHTIPARHNAPFPLLTWDDAHGMIGDRQRYLVMASVTQSGYMPYNIPANPPVERLTDQEKKTIADWVEAGGLKDTCPPAPRASGAPRRREPSSGTKSIGSGAPPPSSAAPRIHAN